MTWSKTVTLWCDGEDCYEWVKTSNATVRATRKNAGDWVYRDGEDLCPNCSVDPGTDRSGGGAGQ